MAKRKIAFLIGNRLNFASRIDTVMTEISRLPIVQSDTKKRELLKNPTKIKEIQEKNLLTEIEPLQFAF